MSNEHAVPTGKRQFGRFPVSFPILVQGERLPGHEVAGTVRNIGAGGLMAELPLEMVPGSAMGFLLQTRRGPLAMEGRVVWTAVIHGMVRHGVAFPEPQGEDFALDLFLTEGR